jgi:transposase
MPSDTSAITPGQLANRFGVGIHKVLSWIASGQLAAVNVATNPHGRPRWVIMPEAIADFERRRAAQPKQATQRRRKRDTTVTEYF